MATFPRACLAFLTSFLAWSGSVIAQPALAPITVELGDVSLTKLPFIAAADNGIYERNGISVEQFITPAAASAIKESAGIVVPPQFIKTGVIGQINIGGGSPTMARMTTIATAPHRVILATTDDYSRYHIIARTGVVRPEDLKGKRFGYGSLGDLGHYSLMVYFRKMGWDPLHDVSMFSGVQSPSAITKGLIDAMAGSDVTVATAKSLGLADILDLRPYRLPMPGSGINALSDWLPRNREAAARFVKSTVEAIALIKTDKSAAFASMRKWYGINDAAQLELVYADAKVLPSKPYPSIEGLKMMQAVYNWREMEIRTPEDFSDSSFVADLDKSGFIDSLYSKNSSK